MSLWERLRLRGRTKPDTRSWCGARVNVLLTRGLSRCGGALVSCHCPHGHSYAHTGEVHLDVSNEVGHPGTYIQSVSWVDGIGEVTLELGEATPYHKREKFPFTVVSDGE